MKRPSVHPSAEKEDKDFQELIRFFNETLGFKAINPLLE
jgi:hypothetical protein